MSFQDRVHYCRQQADASMDGQTRAQWLRIAEGWLQMAMATDQGHCHDFQIKVAALPKEAHH